MMVVTKYHHARLPRTTPAPNRINGKPIHPMNQVAKTPVPETGRLRLSVAPESDFIVAVSSRLLEKPL